MRPQRLLLGTALALVVTAAAAGCVPLPPPIPVAQPPVVPAPTADPIPSLPHVPPSTTPAPVPSAEPASSIGLLWGGNSMSSGSGLSPDSPTTEIIQPTTGTPLIVQDALFGEGSAGDLFQYGEPRGGSANLLLTTTGRLWMRFPDNSWMTCTGTVINSATDNIAVTAAHCLNDPSTGQMAVEVQFVPGYQEGGQPYGLWNANRWWMPQHFIDTATQTDNTSNGDGWAVDFGFVRFDPASDGTQLEQYTGGQGISFTGETYGALSLGYPAGPPFDGETLRYCSTSHPGFGDGYWPHFTMSCAMTGGMSGGPWITDIDPNTGAGYIVAVNSTIPPGIATGTPLGSIASSLLHELETT